MIMIKKKISFYGCKYFIQGKLLKKQEGFTLIEVIVAFFVVSLLTAILLQSTVTALNTVKINKTRTIALAIANEEIEKIRFMDYNDVGIFGGNPSGTLQSQKITDDNYTINYYVTWVNGENSYKQVKVNVIKDPMKKKVEVITWIYSASR